MSDEPLVRRAMVAASEYRLRGADAVCVALGSQRNGMLLHWRPRDAGTHARIGRRTHAG